jgi:hypothetical protein
MNRKTPLTHHNCDGMIGFPGWWSFARDNAGIPGTLAIVASGGLMSLSCVGERNGYLAKR